MDSKLERVFFIVDRTKLSQETDELKDALVVYRPEADLKKPNLEQRCSQLVGISLLMSNFTGTLPTFIRLKSIGFAIRLLGDKYIMGLQSRLEEPKSCVIEHINNMHNFFCFYYCSPDTVLEKMSYNDWEIFTTQMSAIFHCIFDFICRESHSLPTMFNPIPYVILDNERGGTKLFLRAQKILRHCQLFKSIVGGCIFYNGELLCSQLPPELSSKLLLVANGGIELNSRSVLEGQVAPDSVWVIDMYLTPEESALIHHVRHKHHQSIDLYQSLQPNPELSSSVLTASWANTSQLERSKKVHHKRKKDVTPKDENPSTFASNPDKQEDSVTISYGSDAVAYTMTRNMGVSPLKRAKVHGKRSFLTKSSDKFGESTASDLTQSGDNPPPLPPRIQKPPPLPPRIKQEEPPPVPQHRGGPRPPPRGASARNDTEEPTAPRPPPKTEGLASVSSPAILQQNTSFIYQDDISDGEIEAILDRDDMNPPMLGKVPSEDSDVSERFATPPLTSRSEERDLSTDASLPLTHSHSFRTPSESFADNDHTSHSPSHKATDLPLLEATPNDASTDTPSPTSPMYHDSFEVTPQDMSPPTSGCGSKSGLSLEQIGDQENKQTEKVMKRVISSNSSLVMTKGLSEAGSATSSTIFDTEETIEDGEQDRVPDKDQKDDHMSDAAIDDRIMSDTVVDYRVTSDAAVDDCITSVTAVDPSLPNAGHTLPTTNDSGAQALPPTANNDNDDDKVQTPSLITPGPPKYKEVTDGGVASIDELDGGGMSKVRYNTAMPQRIIPVDKSLTRASSEGDLRDVSPVPQELTESTDEEGFYASVQVRGKNFTSRPRAETFIGLKTHAGASTAKLATITDTTEGSCTMERKKLYVQKWFNTMTAIVADDDIHRDHDMIESLWKTMMSELLYINNNVDKCAVEKEMLYISGDAVASTKKFQAGYSNMMGACEVSSVTAPYQFRHAVRRCHQEFISNPELHQISLTKEHCKMISQNILGRESYLNYVRLQATDTLNMHAVLERHAKLNHLSQSGGPGCNVTFL